MEGFTYTNIFDTKGIEYLIIIAFFAILIPFWILLNKRKVIARKINEAWNVLTAELLRIPQGLFFSKNHTWAHLEKSGTAKVGLDDFLLHIVGDVKIKPQKNPGDSIKKNELMAEIVQNGRHLKIFSPISGKIMKTNSLLFEVPEMLNEDPYFEGWIYDIKPSDWKTETSAYYLADEATNWSSRELERFKDFLSVSIGKHSADPSMVALQEGGELRNNVLSDLQYEIWEDFQKEFLG
ncbi:MAG: glycine cleavage system protein H [Bacteroidales bacterium]